MPFSPGWSPDQLRNGYRLPSARKVSTELISSSKMSPDDTLSHMAMQWGQFLDHDLDFAMEAVSRQTFNDGITCRFGHFQTLLCLHCFYMFAFRRKAKLRFFFLIRCFCYFC